MDNDNDLDDLGILILSEECELIESTFKIMKYIWTVTIITGLIMYFS